MIKARILSEKYITTNKDVTCTICTVLIDSDSNTWLSPFGVFQGTAKYNEKDSFSYERGKAIAQAKAERKSYRHWKNYIGKRMLEASKSLSSMTLFYEKAAFIINHDDEYINTLVK